ncbi:rhodanese-like domain-containing protein [Bacteroidota bacterium]
MSIYYTTQKILAKKSYTILALVLLILAFGLVLLPKYKKNEGISPELFVKNALKIDRYISTDLLAERLINQDPTVLLVDTRSENEFNEFALPNAINIPLKNFLDEEFNGFLNQDSYDVVLYSNDHFYANEAWMIGNRLGYQNLYVLKGGLNRWFSTIINPKYPTESMPKKEFDLYSFRKGAGMYFGVGAVESENSKVKKTKKIITVRKKKKSAPEGGC